MSGTMGNFWVGVSGMQTGQYALNTTAHNLTNAGTAGYSRQQVLLTDVGYNKLGYSALAPKQTGLGTKMADVRLIRDRFVDAQYRKELGREQFYQTKYDVVAEVQNYFGELESSTFRDSMVGLWTSAQELQKESNSIVTRSAYIASALTFIQQANEIYDQLTNYQKKLDNEIMDQVDRINELANIIYELNQEIVKVEASGIESANDFRDQRDSALDELSGLISISYHENSNGQVDVYAEGRTLVSMDRVYKIETREVSDYCDYLIPVWAGDQEPVFNVHYDPAKDPRINPNATKVRTPCPELETDTGSLKGIIMSRGDWVPTYADIPVAPKAPERPSRSDFAADDEDGYNAAMEKYAQDYEQYQTDYEKYVKDKEYYNTFLEPYTVGNIIAQFDQLIHGIVTKINDILCPNKEITLTVLDESGNPVTKTYTVLDEEKAGYGMGEENQVQGTELFRRRTVERYTKETVTLEDGTTMDIMVYNEEDTNSFLSMYTLGNLDVNEELLKNPSLLPLSNLQNEELQDIADQLIKVWEDDFATLGPNSLVTNDFLGYYKELIADFSNKGKTYYGIAESQMQAVQEIENQRQSVVGVSTDEELSNLIKFQQGYNASSRYFTVVSEMVEHLINKLG